MRTPNLGLLHGVKAAEESDDEIVDRVNKALEGESTTEFVDRSLREGLSSLIGAPVSKEAVQERIDGLFKECLIPASVTEVQRDAKDPSAYSIKLTVTLPAPVSYFRQEIKI